MGGGYRIVTSFAILNPDSAALTGLESFFSVTQGVALGYYLSGLQPYESAFTRRARARRGRSASIND
jgi:hypothetical protein